ncbi:ARMT1-like domain-containing protein [Desulfoluna sp.]|uniref:damage-control phosphatase ARMT1 family protein n=1 Tax=Desulfoluna sp. TaxID=2045199 RepID=UPI002608157E|nr:ARMT1-like domain-containing protein [Desulfoluna sp.]
MRHECYFCHIKTVEALVRKFTPDAETAEDFIFAVHDLLAANRGMPNPQLATQVHRIAKQHLDKVNLYAAEKKQANDLLLSQYADWEKTVRGTDEPLLTAVKLAVIGNIIDYGAHSVSSDISAQIQGFFQRDLTVDMRAELKEALGRAESVLYLGDNCGEVIFDKLLIETLGHPNVTFVVRGKPIINDVTEEDAGYVGMDRVCRILSNGADAPSTLMDLSSDEFKQAFYAADLVISKGQGNFEGLMENDHPNIFFLLIAKCTPIAELLGVEKNDMVVVRHQEPHDANL